MEPQTGQPIQTSSKNEAKAYRVPANLIMSAVKSLEPFLIDAAKLSRGRLAAGDILDLLNRDLMQVWLVADRGKLVAACFTEVINYPQEKILRIAALVGKDRKRWMHLFDEGLEWGKEQGCTKVEAYVRPGLARILHDFKKIYLVVEREL
jgi:hypothetical protein